MELKVYEDYTTLSVAAATTIIDYVRKNPSSLLCFATGDTPKLTYQVIVEITKRNMVDFSKCLIIGLDEWLGIPPDNSGSCHHFLHKYLFEPLAINSSQIHLFDAMTTNEEEECEKMNKFIDAKGSVDLMLVGVGMNGHIGFNEPGADINSTAHVSMLDEITQSVGQKYFHEKVSICKGITLGLKQVMQAHTLLMMANGKKKAPVIKQAMEEQISTSFPAGFVRGHKNGILMIDREAASELEHHTMTP
jgi:glucosamine-6-phosphate isomerase